MEVVSGGLGVSGDCQAKAEKQTETEAKANARMRIGAGSRHHGKAPCGS